jgi:phosphoribosyl 1,2-cyclic phosphodiesterase
VPKTLPELTFLLLLWNHPHHFTAGSTLDFGTVQVETIPTPHDGVDGVAFIVDDGRSRLGILTDLGHVFSRCSK